MINDKSNFWIMNNDKIDDIIKRLQAEEPVLTDADEMTERIMNALPDNSANSPRIAADASSVFLLFVRALSSAAAVVLVFLFIWQNISVRPLPPETTKDYEQCIAKYKSDYSFDECNDLRQACQQYARQRESHRSVINSLVNEYYEKE